MRLIDADEFKKQIVGMAIINNYQPEKANTLCNIVDKQPSVIDINKVVEKLENYLFEKYCIESDSEIEKIVKTGGRK